MGTTSSYQILDKSGLESFGKQMVLCYAFVCAPSPMGVFKYANVCLNTIVETNIGDICECCGCLG